MKWFKKKKTIRPKEDKLCMPTIEYIENKYGIKLTYPFQIIDDNDDDKYKELEKFGCSDISYRNGVYLHRDCWGNEKRCKKCNFYLIVKEYNDKNNISSNSITDFIKANEILKSLDSFELEQKEK